MAMIERFQIRVRGHCMMPVLAEGAEVTAERRACYWPGDILVIWTSAHQLRVHRLIATYPHPTGWRWMTQADAAIRPDAAVTHTQILGRVQGVRVPWQWRLWATGRGGLAVLRRLRAKWQPAR